MKPPIRDVQLLPVLGLLALAGVSCMARTIIYETNVWVETIAGSGFRGYIDGQGVQTMFDSPSALAVDSHDNIFVWDSGNRRIRKITPTFTVTTFAGSGREADSDGLGVDASFSYITSLAVDPDDNLIVGNRCAIKRIEPDGRVTRITGDVLNGDYIDGSLADARFQFSLHVAVAGDGVIYVADQGNRRIRKVDISAGVVSTVAGSGNGGIVDGVGLFCSFNSPVALAIDPVGNLIVADSTVIRRITPTGIVDTVAGSLLEGGYEDGTAEAARLLDPHAMVSDKSGNLFFSGPWSAVRRIAPDFSFTTVAGAFTDGYMDGQGSEARFTFIQGAAMDSQGRIYVADRENPRIRRITFRPPVVEGLSIAMYAGLSLVGQIGATYRIEYRDDGGVGEWTAIEQITLTESPFLWIDRDSSAQQKRFYRAVRLQ